MNIRFEDKNFNDFELFAIYVWNQHKVYYEQDEYPSTQDGVDSSITELKLMLKEREI